MLNFPKDKGRGNQKVEFYSQACSGTVSSWWYKTTDAVTQSWKCYCSYSISIQWHKVGCVLTTFSLSLFLSLSITHTDAGMVFPPMLGTVQRVWVCCLCGFLLEIHPSNITMALIQDTHPHTHIHTLTFSPQSHTLNYSARQCNSLRCESFRLKRQSTVALSLCAPFWVQCRHWLFAH